MSTPTEPSRSQAPEILGNEGWGPRLPSLGARFDLGFDRDRVPEAVTAVGVALLSAAVLMASVYARDKGPLDATTFTVGVLGVVGLLATALISWRFFPDAERRAGLVSWPGAAGAVGTGFLTVIALDSSSASYYLGSALTIAVAVAGYLLSRRPAFLLAVLAGSAMLYGKFFDDVVQTGGGNEELLPGDDSFMIIGAGVLVFVLAMTLVGWALPETRVLTGVVVGAGGIAAFAIIFQFLTISRYFVTDGAFGDPSETIENPFVNDVWAMLAYSAALILSWSVCAIASGHVGFRVLSLVLGTIAVPVAAFSLVISHPTWWEVVLVAAGGLTLLGALWLTGRIREPAAVEPSPAPGEAQ